MLAGILSYKLGKRRGVYPGPTLYSTERGNSTPPPVPNSRGLIENNRKLLFQFSNNFDRKLFTLPSKLEDVLDIVVSIHSNQNG